MHLLGKRQILKVNWKKHQIEERTHLIVQIITGKAFDCTSPLVNIITQLMSNVHAHDKTGPGSDQMKAARQLSPLSITISE